MQNCDLKWSFPLPSQPPTIMKILVFLYSCEHMWCLIFLNCRPGNQYSVNLFCFKPVSLRYFYGEWFFMHLFTLALSLLLKCLVRNFCQFLKWIYDLTNRRTVQHLRHLFSLHLFLKDSTDFFAIWNYMFWIVEAQLYSQILSYVQFNAYLHITFISLI